MLSDLGKDPLAYASAVLNELASRRNKLDVSQLDQLVVAMDFAVRTAAYSTKAKALLARPLVDRKIDFTSSWRDNAIKLYGLWLKMRPAEVEKKMSELREASKGEWNRLFPDEWDVTEERLLAAYKSIGPLLANGMHGWPETSIALRYYAAQQLAIVAGNRGFFDWGGSDGISCHFAHHHGARDVHLHEPNQAARDFGKWLAGQLGMEMHFHEEDPAPTTAGGRQYGAGICTEVLEHVIDPPGMMRRFRDILLPGGVIFVTSSFGVPQDSHLAQNRKFTGQERQMMLDAGFVDWVPPVPPPMPMLPQWGFFQRPN